MKERRTTSEAQGDVARVRIYVARDALVPAVGGTRSTAEMALSAASPGPGDALASLRQAALADAASRAGMDVELEVEPGCTRGSGQTYLWVTGGASQAEEALDDLWRMGFGGFMVETDDEETRDHISRYHQDVAWDTELVEFVR